MFAERLRALRRRKQLSQQALGRLMGVSPTAVYKWETGQTEPDLETLRAMAELFGVTLDELCGDAADPPAVENISVMARAFRQMTEEEQRQMIALGKTLFAHAFSGEDGHAGP